MKRGRGGDAATGSVASSGIEFDAKSFLETNEAAGVTEESMVLGIDEAGRGPAVGDMVYVGAFVPLKDHDRILQAGVADSKTLSDKNREACAVKLREISTLGFVQVNVTAEQIAHCMTGRHGTSLNTLSHQTAINIIHEATLRAQGRLCAVYVDTVGHPGRYAAVLRSRFPHLKVTVTPKADSKFPIVSAASVIAKSERERNVAELHARGVNVGSGYPGDERCVQWYRSHLHRFFGYRTSDAEFVRMSWAPIVQTIGDACHPASFEFVRGANADHGDQASSSRVSAPQQRKLLLGKQPPRRDPILSVSLGITWVQNDIVAAH